MKPVQIVDSIMGSGKSSWAIQHMNESGKRFLYITPFIKEVSRIKNACHSRSFTDPMQLGKGKLHSLHNLIADGRNIASTHALFMEYTEDTVLLLKQGGYTLILDEVIKTCSIYEKIRKDDIPTMLEMEMISVSDSGSIAWLKSDYDGKYNDIKVMATNGDLSLVGCSNHDLIIWNFPADVFRAFEEVYVMTYMFHSQENRYYYDMRGISYEYNTVVKDSGRYSLEKVCRESLYKYENRSLLKSLVTIVDKDKMNAFGDGKYSLSSSWYKNKFSKDNAIMVSLKNSLYNFYRNFAGSKSGTFMWSSFNDYVSKMKGAGYTKRSLPYNARATNEWSKVKYAAFLVNVFMNPVLSQYYKSHGVEIDEDGLALSEILQWLFRSAIRNGEHVTLYLPSSRMRELLSNYLNS